MADTIALPDPKRLKRSRSPSDDGIISPVNVSAVKRMSTELDTLKDTVVRRDEQIDSDQIEEYERSIRSSAEDMLHQDPRVRRLALSRLLTAGQYLDFTLYPEFCEVLNDDYERCRSLAIKLILIMSSKYDNCLVFQKGTDEQVRLEDDAFSKICRMVTDSATQVRVEAAKAISQFKAVSLNYLLATLDKRDDMLHSGAFVFGLEDEKKDVRMASLESLCHLSKMQPRFAERCLDHIVDMFNDEIEDIRLKAIQCLQEIDNVALRDDQIEIILSVLDSPSMDIREALHRMLAHVNISSARSLRRCIETVLINLARYPQDRLSIFECFRQLGQNCPKYVHLLANELLAVHPYLRLPEQSLIDENYIATLILIFNAASIDSSILNSLEAHTLQHQTYIRHTLPNYIPLKVIDTQISHTSSVFFENLFARLEKMLKSDGNHESKMSLMQMSLKDLQNYGLVEAKFKAPTEFLRIVIDSILTISNLIRQPNWMDSNNSLKQIHKVLDSIFALSRRYHKLTSIQRCCIQQLRIEALAIELVVFINSSNASALHLCDDFMEEVRSLESFLDEEPFLDTIGLSDLSATILEELSTLEQLKPGTVARRLEPLFNKTAIALNQTCQILTLLISSQDIQELQDMRCSIAKINYIPDNGDVPHKFAAGLVLALTIDATIENITSCDTVRIKVLYPDKQAQIIMPIAHHFRLISCDIKSGTSCYRLYTTVNICHSTWTDPSSAELTIALDYRDNQTSAIDLNRVNQARSNEESHLIEICKPHNIRIHPHKLRW